MTSVMAERATTAPPAAADAAAGASYRSRSHVPILVLAGSVAVVTMGLAVVGSRILDLSLRDPDGWLGPSWVRMPVIVGLGIIVDVLPRLLWRLRLSGWDLDTVPRAFREVLVTRWHWRRLVPIALAVGFFYLTYVGYRNLKNFLPFVETRDDDKVLLAIDRTMFFGTDPSAVLHTLLGTGVSAHVLSWVYIIFLTFVPISLVASLVWSKKLSYGLWYATALCLNWALGTLSYYLIPADGPFHTVPWRFWDLPVTDATGLQASLLRSRFFATYDPTSSSAVSGIAAFASLHTSIVFTAAFTLQLLKVRRVCRWAMWGYFGLVVLATVYFGWHYVVDDVAGVAIGFIAVAAGAWASGNGHLLRRSSSTPPARSLTTA